jgi:hypothetical protein
MWTLVFIVRKEHSLRVFENKIMRSIFGPKGDEGKEAGESYIIWSFIISALHQILSG